MKSVFLSIYSALYLSVHPFGGIKRNTGYRRFAKPVSLITNQRLHSMNSKKYLAGALSLATAMSLVAVIPAFADTTVPTTPTTTTRPAGSWQGQARGAGGMHGQMAGMKPAVFGKVSAVSGNTITVSQQAFGKPGTTGTTTTPPAATTFTVDATNAKVTKSNAASTVAAIAVGDMVFVQGTVSGTNVTATTIRDGVMMMRGTPGKPGTNPTGKAPSPVASPITGNGQPVVAGTISAISGSTLSITNKSNVSYTVDASNAKIVQGQNTVTISNVTVGDSVVIQGTVNGNSIVASSVIDQAKPATTATATGAKPQARPGILGQLGQFFSHLFGF